MRLFPHIISVLGVGVLSQGLMVDNCEIASCPLVKCPAGTPEALCNCIVGREVRCAERCPKYTPDYQGCPVPEPTFKSTRVPAPVPNPTTIPKLPTKPVICECIKVSCLQVWPGSCVCANTAAQNCYDQCGGAPPLLQDCLAEEIEAETVSKCECDDIMCVQMWPESCYCANAAADACHIKCGGKKPKLQRCPPQTSKTFMTRTKTNTKGSTLTPMPTPKPLPPNPHKICGGGRANYLICEDGYTCINDPYTPGCGPACDGLGICVKDKLCGGFAALGCDEKSQVCLDDPRDDCDPMKGGADCGGLCIWPHRSLYEDLN